MAASHVVLGGRAILSAVFPCLLVPFMMERMMKDVFMSGKEPC